MTDAARPARQPPLSPHVQVWRWHITMLSSILHRVTGGALYGGALILAIWAICLGAGPEVYMTFMTVLGSIPGKVVMFGLTLAVFYHLGNGVRHLVWDAGLGFDVKTANLTSVATLAFAFAATLAIWVIAAMTGAL